MIDLSSIKSSKSTADLLQFSILNIDKPSGPTSFQVSHLIKDILRVSKTSHFGTLDPQTSGVLPIGLARACRLNEYLMHRDKTYVGIMRLHTDVDDKQLQTVIKKFLGKIQQLPPVRSRVKRAFREREVKTFKILERDNKDVLFETQVQAGTYIRKLCDDIGKEIGGAHMLELRRTQAGIFAEKESHTLYELEKAVEAYKQGNDAFLRDVLIPGEIVATILQRATIHKQVVKKCLSGSPLFPSFIESIPSTLKKGDAFCVFSGEQFIGVYQYIGEETITAKPEFVLN